MTTSIDGDINACPAIDLGKLYLGNVRFLLGRHAPQGMQDNVREILLIHRRLKNDMTMPFKSGGRGTAISGSRPTMMVSLWWRV